MELLGVEGGERESAQRDALLRLDVIERHREIRQREHARGARERTRRVADRGPVRITRPPVVTDRIRDERAQVDDVRRWSRIVRVILWPEERGRGGGTLAPGKVEEAEHERCTQGQRAR